MPSGAVRIVPLSPDGLSTDLMHLRYTRESLEYTVSPVLPFKMKHDYLWKCSFCSYQNILILYGHVAYVSA